MKCNGVLDFPCTILGKEYKLKLNVIDMKHAVLLGADMVERIKLKLDLASKIVSVDNGQFKFSQ